MKRSTSWIAVLPTLLIPISLGMSMYLGLCWLLEQELIGNELAVRYLTGHPISHVTLAMFFVGVASLLAIAKNVFEQFLNERKLCLTGLSPAEPPRQGELAPELTLEDRAEAYRDQLAQLPGWLHPHYLWQRLDAALACIQRSRSTKSIESELKYLSDLDLDRQQQRYALARILIWATPMLGFLGTVLGISEALGGINVGPDNDFQAMMDGLRGSLYVAFDTTALALTLSMVLMFIQFLVDRFELQLLQRVDQRVQGEIASHFDVSASDDQMRAFTDDMVEATRRSVEQQVEIWKKTIRAAEQAWASSLSDVSQTVQLGLNDALDENINNLAHYLGEAIEKADESMSHRWQQWQVTLSENARSMAEHQKQLAAQAQQLESMVAERKGNEVLEQALQQNEQAVAATADLQSSLSSLRETIEQFRETGIKAAVNEVNRQWLLTHPAVDRNHGESAGEQLARSVEEQPPVATVKEHEVAAVMLPTDHSNAPHVEASSQQSTPFADIASAPSAAQISQDEPSTVGDEEPEAIFLQFPIVASEAANESLTDETQTALEPEPRGDLDVRGEDEPTPEIVLQFPGTARRPAANLEQANSRAAAFLAKRRRSSAA